MRAFGLFDPEYVNLNPVPPVSFRPEMWEDFVAIDLGFIKFRELRGLGFSWDKSACNRLQPCFNLQGILWRQDPIMNPLT
jgi:hypothetical protein